MDFCYISEILYKAVLSAEVFSGTVVPAVSGVSPFRHAAKLVMSRTDINIIIAFFI